MIDEQPPDSNPYQSPQDEVLVRPAQPTGPHPGAAPPLNVPALLSLIFGITGFVLCQIFAIPAVICGHIALGQVKREPGRYNSASKGLAIAGTIIGYVAIGLLVLILVIYAAIFGIMFATT